MSSPPLPDSARFALWFSAWVAGSTSLDDSRDAIVGDDAAHDVVGLPGTDGPQPLIVALGILRGHGATGAGIALPAPGDPLGLAGPSAFNVEVVDVGEGVVLDGADLGLVPHRAGAGVVWSCHPAVSRRQVPDPSEADQSLRQTLVRTTDVLADLDVARWRPEVADELMALRQAADFVFPHGMAPRAVRLAALATRCRTIVDLALEDDGGSITAAEADARRQALGPLDHAARRGLVAACSFPWDR
ncbi:hypothetical protein KRR39_07695 [Nocardioides panacis]|uniref:Uncharacterized protein n=1 Tax=Nocardioides panacis TaxID=2849501 RepID=A0A975T179_9ACTN|nr:hypothetical protein [Nocardioides panacis]QWZ09616.1 hypothetical protein KRR39_07695 [Nocardioides panacis]